MVMINNLLYSHSRHEHNGRQAKKYSFGEGDVAEVRYDKGKVFLSLSIYMKAKRNIKAGDHLHSGVYFYDDFKVFVKRESFCCS